MQRGLHRKPPQSTESSCIAIHITWNATNPLAQHRSDVAPDPSNVREYQRLNLDHEPGPPLEELRAQEAAVAKVVGTALLTVMGAAILAYIWLGDPLSLGDFLLGEPSRNR
jgi:hypothetical protein